VIREEDTPVMTFAGPVPAPPASAAQAVAMAQAGLAWLASADAATLATAQQADCLRGLGRMEAMHTAARARVLAAFHAQDGCEDDGHGSTRTWLAWQTRTTRGAAAAAMAWMRRLHRHPAVAAALAAGDISPSWARQVCDWTDPLPCCTAHRSHRKGRTPPHPPARPSPAHAAARRTLHGRRGPSGPPGR
jgi:hypothetical protein